MKFALILALLSLPLVVRAADCNDNQRPVALAAVYTADALANLSGGERRRGAYVDNLDLTASIDGQKALGLQDTCLFVYALYNNGARFSDGIVGDAQVVSNIETDVSAVRLYQAWIDRRFADQKASVRFGLYDLNSEFDAENASSVFTNSAQGIGTDFGQTGLNGPSIFPVTSFAVRGEVALSKTFLVRAAVMDAVPGDPQHPARTTVHLGDGSLAVSEVNYDRSPLRAGLGFWRYSEAFANLATGAFEHGNAGWYGFVETTGEAGLGWFARFGRAAQAFNMFDATLSGGVTYTGLIAGDDMLGVAFSLARTGDTFRRATAGASSELDIELTWQLPLSDHVTVQPDIQYVVNPGANPALGNALVAGLRVVIQTGS